MTRTHDVTISGFDLDRIERAAKYWQARAKALQRIVECCVKKAKKQGDLDYAADLVQQMRDTI